MIAAQQNLSESLQEYFGFSQFKGEQEEIIKKLLEGKDVFVIMPTGGGKSLCYQLPALVSEGTAIVISPLIALMKNQVDLVRNYASNDDIAHFLNSSLNKTQRNKVKQDIIEGRTKLLYVAPETLTKQENIDFFAKINVSFVAVDEAHCISEWGHDFRPEYRNIRQMVEAINSKIPIIALTATATPKVQSDIVRTLDLEEPEIFISSFNRANLYYEIRPKRNDNHAISDITRFIQKNKGKSGIIYVTNRKTAEKVAETLRVNGIKAAPYHAGLDTKTRTQTQDDFLMEEMDVIVATIAFGMGIDKPDIRFIIHFDLAKSLENYYQETGRGGRDGMEGDCIAYFSYKDIGKLEKLLRDKTVAERERGTQLINEMVAYCESHECRRKFILHYFGEFFDDEHCNKMCDNCRNPKEKLEVTDDTITALKAILEVKENHPITYLVDLLMGKNTREITQFKHNNLAAFGAGSEQDETYWNSIIRHAMLHDLVVKDIENYGLLKVSKKGRAFLEKPVPVHVAINHNYEEEADEAIHAAAASNQGALDEQLLTMLKDLRRSVAKQHNLPPYVIFQDASLEDMATRYPISSDEFSHLQGVSKGKALRYGEAFSKLIKDYVEENDIMRPEDFVMKSVVSKSGNKVKIIQSIDRKLSVEDIADNLNLSREEVIKEIETIVHSGTKVNLGYYLNDILDEELVGYIFEYFREAETDSLDAAYEEFQDDEVEIEDLQLVRIQFMSDMAN